MPRKQGRAASILPDLPERSTDPGHIQALRRNGRSFTLADQVNRLVGASEATPDRGFLGRTMALCSLPRSNPGNRHQYKRVNGPYKLIMIAGGDNKLPFGTNPRLILAWLCTEAVRTGSRDIVLGRSLSEFMRKLGISSTDGRGQARLRNQMERLFGCTVSMIYKDDNRRSSANAVIADLTDFWWNPQRPNERVLWESKVRLSESFFNEIVSHPVPLDLTTLKALKRSPLGLDLYLWLVYRTFPLHTAQKITWKQVYRQFGANPAQAHDKETIQNFRRNVLRELKKIKLAWPDLNYTTAPGMLILLPSVPHISPIPEPGPALISS